MAIANVISWAGLQGNSVSTLTNVGVNTTGANLIVVGVTSNVTLTSVTDNKGNTYTKAPGMPNGDGSTTDFSYLYYCESPTVGSGHTLTVTPSSGGAFLTLSASSYSGLAASSSLDKQHNGSGTGTALDSGNTATTTNANALLIGFGTLSTGSDGTFASGTYTVRSQAGAASIGGIGFIMDRIVSATGAYNATASWSNASGPWVCGIAVFSDTSIGGGGITGAVASTLGALTLVSTGTLSIAGIVSKTLAALTLTSTGTLSITGSLASTLASLVLSSSGSLAITGSLANTLAALTLVAQDSASTSGVVSSTLANVTLSAAGALTITGAVGATLGSMTLSSAGSLSITGSLAKTLGTLTLIANDGTVVTVNVSRIRRTILLSPHSARRYV